MTDKEQVVIDGVDVSGCEYACNTAFGKNGCKHSMMKNIYCSKNPNCYFKQLQRKTAECEELKKEIKKLTTEYDRENLHNADLAFKNYQIEKANQRQTKIANDLGKNMLKYEQALNEIEEYLKNECVSCKEQYYNQHCEDCETQYFLNIISKAKDGK